MHRILDLEELRHNEQIQAQERYRKDLNQLHASREQLLHSCRRLQMAQREANRMEADARRNGNLLIYSMVCRQRHTRTSNTGSHQEATPTCQLGMG
jgi:hypothetical protein